MQPFTVELFVDALILVLHCKDLVSRQLANDLISLYEKTVQNNSMLDSEYLALYASLIKQVIDTDIGVDNQSTTESFLLKFKSNPAIVKDPEIYTTLKKIFSDTQPIAENTLEYYQNELRASLMLSNALDHVKHMYGKLATPCISNESRFKLIGDVNTLCNDLTQANMAMLEAARGDNKTIAREVNFSNVASIRHGLEVYDKLHDKNVLTLGLQGMNRALDSPGLHLGESMVINTLSHNGKALENDTPIRVPGGWKRMGDIKVGDKVIAVDGTPTTVTGVYPQGKVPTFRVTFGDGRWVDTCGNHLWSVMNYFETAPSEVKSTKELMADLAAGYERYIPVWEPEKIPDRELPIDPVDLGWEIIKRDHDGLYVPSIPQEYLEASYEQRMQLLRGLGGKLNGGSIFNGNNWWIRDVNLARQIQYLIRSVGGFCFINKKYKDRPYVLHFDLASRLDIRSITPQEGLHECTCITVDHPSKLFVAKDFIVTHNSLVLMKIARWITTLTKLDDDFKKPLCVFYSLENETPQNLMKMFDECWVNEFKEVPPQDIDEDKKVAYIAEKFQAKGWTFVMKREIGADFGVAEIEADINNYIKDGYTPLAVLVDYVNLMKKPEDAPRDLAVRYLYNTLCNFFKPMNCCFITAHQLNREAAKAVLMNPIGAVKRFNESMLSDSQDVQREVDIVFYQHKEIDQHGRAWLTFKQAKHRYYDDTPESVKYFAYMFEGSLGILDDINGPYMGTDNIYAAPASEDESEDDDTPLAFS